MKLTHAYILAGGRSSRFGSDKARALLDGRTLLVRQAQRLATAGLAVAVVAERAGKYDDFGLRTIADRFPGRGPLSGLDAALADAPDDALIALTSCDLVTLDVEWLFTLAAACAATAPAAAFYTDRWQPLPAVYSTRLRSLVARHLAENTLALWRLLEAAGAVRVGAPFWPQVVQVNTPDDLRAAQEKRPGPAPEA